MRAVNPMEYVPFMESKVLPATSSSAMHRHSLGVEAAPTLRNFHRDLLSKRYPPDTIGKLLVPYGQWNPYPSASDRKAWDGLSEEVKLPLMRRGEEALKTEWTVLPAILFLEFARTGNRNHFENVYFGRRRKLKALIIAECIEGKGRFLDQILNGIWFTCEETFWGIPATTYAQKAGTGLPDVAEPTIDLFAGETSSLLSWTDYLLGPQLEQLSPLVRSRIRFEINRRVLDPELERDDFAWMGLIGNQTLSNWNPWINSNLLITTLLMEEDESRRARTVAKIVRSLDQFINQYPEDGGCDEGPNYWAADALDLSLCLEYLSGASHGAIDASSEPLFKRIGEYIYHVHIADGYYINLGDASAKASPPGDLTYRFGRSLKDEKLAAFGVYCDTSESDLTKPDRSIGIELPAIFDWKILRSAPSSQVLERDVWLPDSELMVARIHEGSTNGFYLGAQAGTNGRVHGHNDTGSFIVFHDGTPVLIDPGVGAYTAATFNAHRYDIWTMQSSYHNLPDVNGVMQQAGNTFRASNVHYLSDDTSATLSCDIAGAYPQAAELASWKRTVGLERRKGLIMLTEECILAKDGGVVTCHFMTPRTVEIQKNGQLRLSGSPDVFITYDESLFKAKIEPIPLTDSHLSSVWGKFLYRIHFDAIECKTHNRWTFTLST
jgi:hypothetical protein